MYLWNLEHHSFNPTESTLNATNVRGLTPEWISQLDGKLAAAPTVENGVLYIGGWDGYFYAVDAKDGHVIWKTYVGKAASPADPTCFPAVGVSGQAVVHGDVVYVPGGDVQVYALDKATGNERWRLPVGNPEEGAYLWSSLVLFENLLYVGVASLGDCPLPRGALVRIDLDRPQEPLIKFLAPEDEVGAGIWSTPAIDAATRTIFAATGTADQDAEIGRWGGTLLKLDADTLEVKGYYFLPTNSTEDDIEWGSSPTLFSDAGGTPLVAATGKDGNLYALRQEDLEPVWIRRIALGCICPECGCGSLSTPAFDGFRLYVGAGAAPDANLENGSVYSIDPTSGEVIWRKLVEGVVIAPVTVANGVVYVSTTAGLEVFDAASGERLFRSEQQRIIYSQPVVCNGRVYSTFLSGTVISWQAPDAAEPESQGRPLP